ncbi:hypothetical protein BC936DRAFT_148553 [Jimgerdemannia flammicorona]|uniref:Uncharacterized protein n=1 Tax=Jimgerdemannia flammicorona TaxID=994334 RepID=A0A433D2S8_9FUNG|nr:hypothetical protein BC936DRAFT_148553 [Jimgerdemannia flammicorona]
MLPSVLGYRGPRVNSPSAKPQQTYQILKSPPQSTWNGANVQHSQAKSGREAELQNELDNRDVAHAQRLQRVKDDYKRSLDIETEHNAEYQRQLGKKEAEIKKLQHTVQQTGEYIKRLEKIRDDSVKREKECTEYLKNMESAHNDAIKDYETCLTGALQEIECLKNTIQLRFGPEHHRLREEIKTEFQHELSKAEQQISHLTYENERHREQKEDYLIRIEKMNFERSEIYSKIMDLEKKLVLEMSFRPQVENHTATGIFAMDGANPMKLNQTLPKVYMKMRKIVENMLTRGALKTEAIRVRYDELLRHATIPTDRANKLSRSVQKRVVEHAISVTLAAIWDVILLGEGGKVERRAGGVIFPEIEQMFDELRSLQDGEVSEMSVLVGRMKAELARQLLGKLPVPTEMEVEKLFNEQPDYNPFAKLGYRHNEKMFAFWYQMAEAVFQTLVKFTDKNVLKQWESSVRFLVYTCIHVRLQMEVIGSGGMTVYFAGSTIDYRAILKDRQGGQRGKAGSVRGDVAGEARGSNAVRLESELHDAVESINRSKRDEECEEDELVFLTIFPGIANVKVNNERITVDQIEKQCSVLSC